MPDNLRNRHGRIKLHGALVGPPHPSPPLFTFPLPLSLTMPASQSNLPHSSDGSDKLGEHMQRHCVS